MSEPTKTIIMSNEDIEELQRLLNVRDELQREWRLLLDAVRANNQQQKELIRKYMLEVN